MAKYLYYENGMFQEMLDTPSSKEVIGHIAKKYIQQHINWETDISIRIFQELVNTSPSGYKISIYHIGKNGEPINPSSDSVRQWTIKLSYKETNIEGNIYDKTDTTIYVLWESIQRILKTNLDSILKDIKFEVKLPKGEITQKAKFILFFSNPKHCGITWKYSDLRVAMEKEGLAMVGRGIEGERPRECRYALGYDWRTNEQDKNVPDGYCLVGSPFPFGKRNERRMATVSLSREDWSELKELLEKSPKKLRCFVCGLFEGEINHIGQKTAFQKGHGQTHLGGGTVSKENIIAICRYCNTEQGNIYDIDTKTGKKKYKVVPYLKKRDYQEKLEAFKYLAEHLNKEDVKRLLKGSD